MMDDVREKLSTLLGPRGYTEDAADMAPWLTDWRGRYHGRAMAMVSPASTQQVVQIVQICAAHRIPIVPQGGNSGMVAGATPDNTGAALLLSLRRMDAIGMDRIDEGLAVCEAGVILQTLHASASPRHHARAGRRAGSGDGGRIGHRWHCGAEERQSRL
jgi:FAD/FMN-containing dehydrogenase